MQSFHITLITLSRHVLYVLCYSFGLKRYFKLQHRSEAFRNFFHSYKTFHVTHMWDEISKYEMFFSVPSRFNRLICSSLSSENPVVSVGLDACQNKRHNNLWSVLLKWFLSRNLSGEFIFRNSGSCCFSTITLCKWNMTRLQQRFQSKWQILNYGYALMLAKW